MAGTYELYSRKSLVTLTPANINEIYNRQEIFTNYVLFILNLLLLEYTYVVWDNCTQEQINELKRIQIAAARIVSGTTKLVAINKLYRELGWLKLSEKKTTNYSCFAICRRFGFRLFG